MIATALVHLLIATGGGSLAADEHLLAGAEHFRGDRYAQALVEFSVAERLGAGGDATWYVAATLVKLQRPEDALEAFARAEAAAPQSRDALLDYYHALACYDARLYHCADGLLASMNGHVGPRLAEQVNVLRSRLAGLFIAEPSLANVDWYHARAAEAVKQERHSLALAYLLEAAALGDLRKDHYRVDEARRRASEVARATPRRG